jgi:Holliday junction resolvasome RuvABC DNA-binding subunit
MFSICLSCAFMQDFLQELSENDEKIKSLVSMGFPEDEAKTAITRCGMPLEFAAFTGRDLILPTLGKISQVSMHM